MFLIHIKSVSALNCSADEYSMVVALNLQLQELDLSSLETVSNGGLVFVNNPQLCYVGNLSMYLTTPSEQHQCISTPRRDPQTCSEHPVHVVVVDRSTWLHTRTWLCTCSVS